MQTSSVAACFFTTIRRDKMRGRRHLGPMIEERLKQVEQCRKECVEKPVSRFILRV